MSARLDRVPAYTARAGVPLGKGGKGALISLVNCSCVAQPTVLLSNYGSQGSSRGAVGSSTSLGEHGQSGETFAEPPKTVYTARAESNHQAGTAQF